VAGEGDGQHRGRKAPPDRFWDGCCLESPRQTGMARIERPARPRCRSGIRDASRCFGSGWQDRGGDLECISQFDATVACLLDLLVLRPLPKWIEGGLKGFRQPRLSNQRSFQPKEAAPPRGSSRKEHRRNIENNSERLFASPEKKNPTGVGTLFGRGAQRDS